MHEMKNRKYYIRYSKFGSLSLNANLLLLKCVPTISTRMKYFMSFLQKNVTQLGHWFNARAALPLSIVSQKLGIFHNNQAFYRQKGGGGKTAGRKNSNPYLGNDSQIEALVTNFSAPTTTTTATSSTTALQHANSGKQQFFFSSKFNF